MLPADCRRAARGAGQGQARGEAGGEGQVTGRWREAARGLRPGLPRVPLESEPRQAREEGKSRGQVRRLDGRAGEDHSPRREEADFKPCPFPSLSVRLWKLPQPLSASARPSDCVSRRGIEGCGTWTFPARAGQPFCRAAPGADAAAALKAAARLPAVDSAFRREQGELRPQGTEFALSPVRLTVELPRLSRSLSSCRPLPPLGYSQLSGQHGPLKI